MIQTVNINVAALPSFRGPSSFMVLSQNENGRQIRFRILGSDLPTGCTATFSGTKPDGNVYSTAGTVDGNFVIVQEDIQMTAVAGIWDAKLEIVKGTENIVTSVIRVTIARDPVAGDAIPSDSQLDGIVAEVKYYAEHARSEAYGSPLTAPTKAQMTDHTRVYVYTGSEPNMVAGNWYHWNGTAWISGGVYNAVAVQTDATLSVAGKAADAKKTGDEISGLKEDLNAVETDVTRLPSVKDSDVEGVDLDVSDAQGNVIVRFKNGHIETKNFKSEELSPTVITLKADGTGDFTTLRAALDSITDADPDTKPYEIHVYPGTYNTLEGYTDAEIRSADIGGGYSDTSMVGAKATNGISIIGIGDRESIIFTAELATADYPLAVRGNISTLNMQGTGRFENLTILAKNIRYCVHDDFRCLTPYKRIVKNCVFRGSALSYNPPTTYGAGISYGGITALFEDCDFGYDWGMHNRMNMSNDSVVILRHCTGHCARVNDSSYDADTAIHHYIFDSCNFLKLTSNKTNGTIPHILVDGTDSEDIMCFAPSTVIPQVGQLLKQKVSSIAIGSLVEFADDASYISLATNKDSAIGVLVARDTNYDYVQTKGYINSSQIGLSDLAVGDYIGLDASMKLVKVESASDAIGVVKYNSSSVAQIKIWGWS